MFGVFRSLSGYCTSYAELSLPPSMKSRTLWAKAKQHKHDSALEQKYVCAGSSKVQQTSRRIQHKTIPPSVRQ